MHEPSELKTLLSQIVYNKSYDALDGLEPIRTLLEKDHEATAVQFLTAQLFELPEKIRGGIAFALAEHFLKTGDLNAIDSLYATEDVEVQEAVLNGLWSEPYACKEMGPGIVALAVKGAQHRVSEVRTESAYVIMNQCAWGVDVTETLNPLLQLLNDPVPRVLEQAAYAIGNIAKGVRRLQQQKAQVAGNAAAGKYNLSPHLLALIANLRHADFSVRSANAWALWQLSKRRYDLAPAITELTHLLTSTEDYDAARKNAAGALLHHARKSVGNRDAVKEQIEAAALDLDRKEITRFLKQLAALN